MYVYVYAVNVCAIHNLAIRAQARLLMLSYGITEDHGMMS